MARPVVKQHVFGLLLGDELPSKHAPGFGNLGRVPMDAPDGGNFLRVLTILFKGASRNVFMLHARDCRPEDVEPRIVAGPLQVLENRRHRVHCAPMIVDMLLANLH